MTPERHVSRSKRNPKGVSATKANMTTNKHRLSSKKKRELVNSIKDFQAWLRNSKKLPLDPAKKYSSLTFPRPTSADWIMKVEGSEVQFNTYVRSLCTFDYFRMVVLHECFHLFVQDVPNKSDAKRLKDDFGDVFMKLFDIEADYYTAMYYKEMQHASLVDIFALFYEGSKIFGDPRIRAPKVERFIGSVLSIANAFFTNPGSKPSKENNLYLPNISNIPTEESIHILISKRNYFLLGEIQADIEDFKKIKKCYTQVNGAGRTYYVDTLLRFASKALRVKIPPAIYEQLHELEDPTQTSHVTVGEGGLKLR